VTWTYSANITTDKDKVRLLIGDTDTTDQQFQDEEIAWFLQVEPSFWEAAQRAVSSLIAKYSRLVSVALGDAQVSYGQRVDHYKELLTDIKSHSGGESLPIPQATGLSLSGKSAAYRDRDRNGPMMVPGFMDNPGGVGLGQPPAGSTLDR
jgi:hypothetical protein